MDVFFVNDTATTEIYTLSLHDALPICGLRQRQRRPDGRHAGRGALPRRVRAGRPAVGAHRHRRDRKSTRLNSSYANISYAVFCLKKKETEMVGFAALLLR